MSAGGVAEAEGCRYTVPDREFLFFSSAAIVPSISKTSPPESIQCNLQLLK